jgi:hypothetical protein
MAVTKRNNARRKAEGQEHGFIEASQDSHCEVVDWARNDRLCRERNVLLVSLCFAVGKKRTTCLPDLAKPGLKCPEFCFIANQDDSEKIRH